MIPVPHLLGRIADLAGAADGLTVSGGEPFEQPEVLALVLRRWRQVSSRSTFVYTGWEFEDVAPWLAANKGLVDAVMTGPFRSELPQTRALRGSDNQTLHVLSELGAGFLAYERPSTPADRRLDVEFDDKGEAWFAGIPARGDLARLRRAFAASGHSASTSDMVGGLAG
jgi:anaerobic ribonucleoside-triphosphate reductase activating protein